MNTDSFVNPFVTIKHSVNDLKRSKKDLIISDKDSTHELSSKDNMKIIGETKIESSADTELDEVILLRSKSCILKKTNDFV